MILRIGLNVCLSILRKYHFRREIIRDLSITLTNQSLYMPVNQPCWLAISNGDSDPCQHLNIFIQHFKSINSSITKFAFMRNPHMYLH